MSDPQSPTRWRAEGAEGAGHGAGGFPAVSGLLMQGLQEDSLHAFGGIGAEGPEGQGGVLEDDLVGIGLARVEAEIGVLAGQQIKQASRLRCRCRRARGSR